MKPINATQNAKLVVKMKKIIISKSTKGTFISSDITKAKEIKINELITKIKDLEKELISFGLTKEEIIKRLK